MNPNQGGHTGSFNAPAGGQGSAIAAAMARRGFAPGGGVTNQQGPAAPNPSQAVLPPPPTTAHHTDAIIKAMDHYMKGHMAIEKAKHGIV